MASPCSARGYAPAKEVGAYHFYRQPGIPQAEDPCRGDGKLFVFGIEGAPLTDAGNLRPPRQAKGLNLFFHCLPNPAPFAPPFLPPSAVGPFWIDLLGSRPRDPSDGTRKGLTRLDSGGEIMAEQCGTRMNSDEVLAKMGENGHTRYDIWRKI